MKSKPLLASSSFAFSLLLILLAPLHGALSVWLIYGLKVGDLASWLPSLVAAWKELIILLLCGLAALRLAQKPSRWTLPHSLITGFILLGLAVTALQGHGLPAFLWGGRTEFSFLLLLGAWGILIPDWNPKQIVRILRVSLAVGILVLLFGLFLGIVGHDWLVNLGFRDLWSTFSVGEAPSYCQREGGDGFCRWQSAFVGPNRYAGYLLTLLPLVAFMRVSKNADLERPKKLTLLALALISLIFTNSMAAFLGLVGAIFVGLLASRWGARVQKKHLIVGGALVLGLGVAAALWLSQAELDASSSEHITRSVEGLRLFFANPLGIGLGQSGPAAYKLGIDFVPENWFLQVGINVGWLGLALFLGLWASLLKRMSWKTLTGRAALLALVAVLVQNLFLHTLEEVGVYAPLMMLVAMACFPIAQGSPQTRSQ